MSTTIRSAVFRRRQPVAGGAQIGRLMGCRDACAPADVSFPAAVLGDAGTARWLRGHRLSIDVRSMSDLRAATSAGIPPAVMTVHADRLDESQLHGVGRLAPGRVVLGCTRHIEAVAGGLAGREQNVLLCMGDHATDADGRRFACHSRDTDLAVRELMDRRHCSLIGLHGDISVVTDLIAQMDHIRRCHGVEVSPS